MLIMSMFAVEAVLLMLVRRVNNVNVDILSFPLKKKKRTLNIKNKKECLFFLMLMVMMVLCSD